jgi:hypothetical protein
MRLIDLDAFREEYDLREHCEDCGRRNKKACDYPSYSARDFCGWLDDAPTVDAVPIKAISAWLAAYAAPPNYALEEICNDIDPDRIVYTANDRAMAWEYHWEHLMDCGLLQEEPNGTDNP